MTARGAQPPRVAESLLRLVVPAGVVGDSIVGDAREEYEEYVRSGRPLPRLWYWKHVGLLVAGYLTTTGRDVEMGAILNDLRFGARSLMRMPGSAAVAVVVLAIGIGLCSFMFSIIYGVYLRGMDIPEADRVFLIFETRVEHNQFRRQVPIQNFADWREQQTAFEELAGSSDGTVNISGADEPVRFQGAFVSANAFSLLGVEPVIGRGFAVGDDEPGAPADVVLGYAAWRDRYGSDRSVLGRAVRVNGEPGTVIGVMPAGFAWPNNTEVWVPLRDDELASERGEGRHVMVWGRLRDGVTRDRASMEMSAIAARLEQEYPDVNEGIGALLYTPVQASTNEILNMGFGAMMVAVICVLLVACANVANLLLARAAMRTKEAGVRMAMGGSRLRVMLPFLAEALVLALVGAALGVGIAYVGAGWFDNVTDPVRTGRPWFIHFRIDLPILGFVICVGVLTALVAGLVPAFQMSRTDVGTVLRDKSRGSSSLRVGRLSQVLVTAEVALSVALLVGAGLMTKSLVELGDVEYPFATDELFTARLGLVEADYPDREARMRFWDDLLVELNGLPTVSAAGLTQLLPFTGSGSRTVAIDGVRDDEDSDYPELNRLAVSERFFEAIGSEIVAGRDFTVSDDHDSEPVAIVNQPMVDRYFSGQNPIGRRFREGASDALPVLTVVGVVPDLLMDGPQGQAYEPAGYYVPLRQSDASFMSIVALTRSGSATSITPDVRGAVRRVDADLPIFDVFSQAEVADRQTWFFGTFGTVFIVFGVAALLMASVGLYGMLSFAVSRRTQEMGIRMALGAAPRDVIGFVARQGALQLGIGLAIGLAMAFGVTRVVAILMYQVDPQDPAVFGGVISLIVVVGMAAAYFPARRATSVDPVEALRAE